MRNKNWLARPVLLVPFSHSLDCSGAWPHLLPLPRPLPLLPLAQMASLAAGGLLVGLTAGYATRRLLRHLRWRGASTSQEVAAILGMSYFSYFCADAILGFSGEPGGWADRLVVHSELKPSWEHT